MCAVCQPEMLENAKIRCRWLWDCHGWKPIMGSLMTANALLTAPQIRPPSNRPFGRCAVLNIDFEPFFPYACADTRGLPS